jgi:hypothetical protein
MAVHHRKCDTTKHRKSKVNAQQHKIAADAYWRNYHREEQARLAHIHEERRKQEIARYKQRILLRNAIMNRINQIEPGFYYHWCHRRAIAGIFNIFGVSKTALSEFGIQLKDADGNPLIDTDIISKFLDV